MDLDVTLHQLRVFREVAQQGHFTRAAEALYISQPAVSRCIKDLERQVGMPLLEPIGRRVQPTEAGRVVLLHAERVLVELSDAGHTLAAMRDGGTGRLVLGASSTPGTYLLPAMLGQFRRDHPCVDVLLEIADTHEVVTRVQNGRLDLGLVGEAEFPATLKVEPFRTDRLVLILSPAHPLAGRGPVMLSDLADEPFVLRERGSSTREVLERTLHEREFQPKAILELGTTEAVKKAVSAGLGISFVSEYAVELECRAEALAAATVDALDLRRGIYLVQRSSFTPSPLYRRFLAALREVRPALDGMAREIR